jgi:hemolysin III
MSTIVIGRGAIPDPSSRTALLVKGEALDSRRQLETAAQGRDEELVNSITHGVGLALSIAGVPVLVALAGTVGSSRCALGCSVFGGSLILLYAASTLCHSWPVGELKRAFLVLDHIGIYCLIAGTFTPVAMFASQRTLACSALTVAWGFAVIGSFAKVVRMRRLKDDSPIPYLVMSVCVMSFSQLLANLPPGESSWLLSGGLFYAGGLLFYFNDQKRFYHSIWHLFVLAGSICHYRAVLGCVTTAMF